jgi:hypothetical protein
MAEEGITSPVYHWDERPETTQVQVSTYLLNGRSTQSDRLQFPEVYLQSSFSLYKYTPTIFAESTKYLQVRLNNCSVNPSGGASGIMFDDEERRGWFTEYVSVKMWFDDPARIIELVADAPPTTEVSGSNSVSNSLGFDFNLGTFGDTPTGGTGVSASHSWSTTVSLSDFEVQNQSSHFKGEVLHKYRLAMTGDGTKIEDGGADKAYRAYVDESFFGSVSSVLTGGRVFPIRPVPDRAKFNLPLISQALFKVPGDYVETRKLHILVEESLVMIEQYGTTSYHQVIKFSHAFSYDIPFGHIR